MTTDGGGLTRQQLADLLDRHGARPASWPAGMRDAAERLIAADPAARATFVAATSVDSAVHAMMQGEAAPPVRRVHAAYAQPVPSWRRLAGFGMAALAASLAIGFVVGTTLPSTDDDDGTDYTTIAVNDVDLGGVL
ncbi:hypothetical protein SAMN02745157_1326 [Kaistia soli DSM 19436]|uniref:Uncharacterized protein n=1 Tax=Kaistia soli DSM 19436 TaxID=1122133 RepID=A0A1M4XSJ4_9HYPH|nr:hypothetical protein [Kaistia soli]SHE96253.1 hypothetical protein SAMN02745157_1326 [Kaistia soli DSM 19436]